MIAAETSLEATNARREADALADRAADLEADLEEANAAVQGGDRETVVVTKVVEVEKVTTEQDASGEENQTLMIIIPSAIVGVLLIAAIAIGVRVCVKKGKAEKAEIPKFKSSTIEVEPQFVLAADDSKDIFGRNPANDIEDSENKKTKR